MNTAPLADYEMSALVRSLMANNLSLLTMREAGQKWENVNCPGGMLQADREKAFATAKEKNRMDLWPHAEIKV